MSFVLKAVEFYKFKAELLLSFHNSTGWPDWISWLWSISGSQIYLTNIWKMISFLKHLTGGSSSIFCQLMQISRTSCHEIQRLIQHSCFSLDGASKCYVIILSILQLIHQIIHYWNFFLKNCEHPLPWYPSDKW